MRTMATSLGLWRRRHDLATLLDATILPPFAPIRLADAFVGWGAKPSGTLARLLAERHGKPLTVLEDGFLGPRSYTLDRVGAHYEADRPTDLQAAIRGGVDAPTRERARAAMARIVARRLTKYNDAPLLDLPTLGLERPFVLLVEQVEGDLSLGADGAEAFRAMLREAAARYPEHTLVVRPHPAAKGNGPLERAAAATQDARVLRERCNPWPLLKGATRVFTHSSHLGFEALMAGTPVTCTGSPFYAGWGLTEDHWSRGEADLETVFAAAYLDASRYLDLHDGQPSDLETTITSLATIRDARAARAPKVATGGLSPWKRRAVEPFVTPLRGSVQHHRTLEAALRAADAETEIAVWGADITLDHPRTVRLEDGFVRSAGLGAALRMPLSLICEARDRLPFDARGTNGIERILLDDPPSPAECERARRLIERIVGGGVTKYMVAGTAGSLPEDGRLKVLVVGQVEDDASIRFGSPKLKTNSDLLAAVRALYPDALIAYRDHPDVARGLRPGKARREHVDLDVDAQPITALLAWCDRVETMTSGTGFEALLRGVPVGTHGWPFYAGWGLTDDRLDQEPRGRASLLALAAAALIRVPTYIHPTSRLPCTPERAIEVLANPAPPTLTQRLILHPAGLAIGRLKHLARDKSR